MFGGKEFWVELIGYASIVSVAIFGLVGALSKEWDRRREKAAAAKAETRTAEADGSTAGKASSFSWSYVAAIGIILSAVFAMTSNILQDWIDTDKQAEAAEKALADRREQDRRFNTQLGQLTNLNGQMRTVNEASRNLMDGMGRSLRSQDRLLTAQDVLLTNARRAMLQEGENTGRVLRAMWEDANRIDGSGIQIAVQITCPIEPDKGSVRILPAEAVVRLRVVSAQSARSEVTLRTTHQDTQLMADGTESDRASIQFSAFGPFAAESLSPFDRLQAWNGALVDVTIIGTYPNAVRNFLEATGRNVLSPHEREQAGMVASEFRSSSRMAVRGFPCQTRMDLLLNHRLVATLPAETLLISSHDGRTSDQLIVRSSTQRLDPALFPLFNQLQ